MDGRGSQRRIRNLCDDLSFGSRFGGRITEKGGVLVCVCLFWVADLYIYFHLSLSLCVGSKFVKTWWWLVVNSGTVWVTLSTVMATV